MKRSQFVTKYVKAAREAVDDPTDNEVVLKTAIAMLGDQKITDEDGNEIEIDSIVLMPVPGENKQDGEGDDPDDTDDPDGKRKQDDDDDTAQKIAKIVDGRLKAFADSIGDVTKSIKAQRAQITGGDMRNDDARQFGFKGMGEQLQCIYKHFTSQGQVTDKRLMTKAPQGMNVSIPSEGGFLLAPEYADRVLEIVHQEQALLAMTDGLDINGPAIKVPAIDETSRATGSRRGGVRGYWLAEADALTASKPKVRQIEMTPHKLGILAYATEELLDDGGPALQQLIERSAAEEITFMTGNSIINGDGAGKPLGVLNAPCLITQAKETNQAANTILHENIINMWSRLHVSARNNAVWLINQECEPQLATMSLAVGTGGVPTYLPPGGLSDKPYGTLYGRPVIATEFNAALGTKGDVILGDLKHYLSVTRGAIKSAVSMHVQFVTDEMAFRFIFRIDGQPWWNSALTPFKGAATQGPFVTLATRS